MESGARTVCGIPFARPCNTPNKKPQQPETPKAGFEVPAGPPQDWDKNAQAAWQSLPHEARQAILRSDKTKFDALEPHFRKYRELDTAIAPHRHVIPAGRERAAGDRQTSSAGPLH